MTEYEEKLVNDFERVRRSMSKYEGVKGAPLEYEYSRLYDRLAMKGIGNRRRLRKKYRGT